MNFRRWPIFFARQLHQVLKEPIGLIDCNWGGSTAEAWIRLDLLEKDPKLADTMKAWKQIETNYDFKIIQAEGEQRRAKWEKRVATFRKANKAMPPPPADVYNHLAGMHRPANCYNGMLHPILGYGLKGAIWYQGESNGGRGHQYRHLFPKLIQSWRDEWGIGDFPFYWVQLADFGKEPVTPDDDSARGRWVWAELREAQTMTLSKLNNTGEAVIINLGDAGDLHPRNKQDVGLRLSRWALNRDYGMTNITCQSPLYSTMKVTGNEVELTFTDVGGGLITFERRTEVKGFSMAGHDKKFVWAEAKIVSEDKIVVWSDKVLKPVSVRYAWANNPVCNVYTKEDLELTPFRTDKWESVTKGAYIQPLFKRWLK